MKNRTVETIAFIFGLLTALTGFLTLPQVALLPESFQPYVGFALAMVIVGKNGAYVVLDFLDNGKLDKSWKHGATILTAGWLAMGLVSCATRPDGTRTFIGLDRKQWLGVGKDAAKAAASAAGPAYREQLATSGKQVQFVDPRVDYPVPDVDVIYAEAETKSGFFDRVKALWLLMK